MQISAPFFWAVCAVLLLFMGAAMGLGIVLETQTYDEGIHVSLGFAHWTKGEFSLGVEHPPLGRLLCALPLLFTRADIDTQSPNWQKRDQVMIGADFVYRNRVSGNVILGLSRSVTAIQTLILGVLIAMWTARRFGRVSGLIAVMLFALSPNFIAHGHYATNDVPVTLFIFATTAAWLVYLENLRFRYLLLSGVLLGLTLVCKFSGVLVVPAMAALWIVQRWRNPGTSKLPPVRALAVAAVLAAIVIIAVYGPATVQAFTHDPRLEQVADRSTGAGRLLDWFARSTPLPAHPYLVGLQRLASYTAGQPAYLLGRVSRTGWWYYFPVAMAVKSTTAFVGLFILASVLAACALLRETPDIRRIWNRMKAVPLVWFAIVLPPLTYFAAAMYSGMNIGIRHVLPVYPFVIVFTAAVLGGMRARRSRLIVAILAGGAVFQVYENARVFPHYLAFFNTPAGGPENGSRYLLDSNIDWGQDVVKLGRYLDRIGYRGDVCKAYFGTTRWWYYGVPESHEPRQGAENDCLAAVSVTALHGVYTATDRYRWLRDMEPVARVGYSIYLYDLRANRTPIDWKDRGVGWR